MDQRKLYGLILGESMNYLVTGSAGFIGSACAAFLIPGGGQHVQQSIIFQRVILKEYHKDVNLLEEMFLILV